MIRKKQLGNKLAVIEAMRTAVAIVVSLIIVFVIIFMISETPIAAIREFVFGPLTSIRRIGNVIEASVPLMFTGLAVILLQRSGLYNLAMEGAFFMGAVASTAISLMLDMPAGMNLLFSCIAGCVAGGIICAVPTVLKVKCEANVLVTSLMMNYICLYLGFYVVINFFQDPKMNSNYSFKFAENVQFRELFSKTRINSGLILCFICVALVWLLLNKTSFGYKVTMVGKNAIMTKYAGMNIGKLIISSSIIGGALAGLGGSVDLFGMYNRFQYSGLAGYGWDGILIAIVARHKVQYVPIAALFLAYLRIGADVMSIRSDIPSEMIKIIQAVVIVLISAQAILSKYKKQVIIQEAKAGEAV